MVTKVTAHSIQTHELCTNQSEKTCLTHSNHCLAQAHRLISRRHHYRCSQQGGIRIRSYQRQHQHPSRYPAKQPRQDQQKQTRHHLLRLRHAQCISQRHPSKQRLRSLQRRRLVVTQKPTVISWPTKSRCCRMLTGQVIHPRRTWPFLYCWYWDRCDNIALW